MPASEPQAPAPRAGSRADRRASGRVAGLGAVDGLGGAVAEQLAPAAAVVRRGLGRPDEVLDDLHEPVRVVLVREVAAVGQHLDDGARGDPGDVLGVLGRDDDVVGAPHHEHRHRLGQVGPVDHGDDLALHVDHGADHVADRGPGARVLERLVDLGDLVEVAGRRDAGARQRPHGRPCRRAGCRAAWPRPSPGGSRAA